MKKSLVITTIATILVIVVALTTATFAWFSSGDESNVTSSFTAQADNAAFSFSKWEGTDYAVTSSTTIDFTDAEGLYGTNPYAYWSTNGMKAVAPINEINLSTVDTFAGSEVAGGTVNTGNTLKVKITKKFEDTQASKILRLVEDAQENKPKAQKLITKFAAIYTPAVFALALIVAFLPPLFYESYAAALTGIWLKKALVFLVISCPCALVISIPLAFFAGIGKCSKKGVLVKGGNYLEAMRNIDTVCMDKTGTITKGVFEVTSAVTADGISLERLKEAAGVCESMSTHPIAVSVMKYVGTNDVSGIGEYREFSGRGVSCEYKGKRLLAGNLKLMKENGVEINNVHEGYGSVVYFAEEGKELGYVTLSDTVKDGAKDVIAASMSLSFESTILDSPLFTVFS